MARRSPRKARTLRALPSRALPTIEPRMLGGVIGGRISPRTTLDPTLLQGIQDLSQAIMSVGQNMAAAKQNSTSQMMQLLQQKMQGGSGPGAGPASGPGPGPGSGSKSGKRH